MTPHSRLTFASLLVTLAALAAAEPPAPATNPAPPPHVAGTPFLLARPGKVLFEDDFARAELGPKWKQGKGYWTMEEAPSAAQRTRTTCTARTPRRPSPSRT